jgi:hypothetical protein
MLMLKRKVPVKVVKVELLKTVRHFSVWQLLLFAAVFAGIGGYIIYHSFAATTTTTTSTWTTYASPWGDKSSGINNAGATINCANTKSASCLGSCFVTNGSTNGCRPWTTKTCPDAPDGSNVTNATIENSQIDQGVDYTVWDTASSCTYNNPNPKDVGGSNSNKSVTNTRVYAMGRGIITCLGANPSTNVTDPKANFMQTLMLSQRCPGGKVHIGDDACPPGSNNPCVPPHGEGTWLVYKLTDSGSGFPAHGLKIYVSEGCTLSRQAITDATTNPVTTKHRRWKVGDHVTPNSVLCEISPGTIEMGWANEGRNVTPGGTVFKNEAHTAALKCFESKKVTYGYWSTAWGLSFNNFVLKYDGNRVAGYRGPNAYNDCKGFRKQAKYKINW